MENKLQELTQKLYNEGLSKGREQADQLVAEAEAKAAKIVAEATAQAEKIMAQARRTAEEFAKNTQTEVTLASRQAVATLKQSIAGLIVARGVSSSVSKVNIDPSFIKEMLLTVARNWNGVGSQKLALTAQLPVDKQAELDKEMEASAKELMNEGVEITYTSAIKSGFRIAPKDGGYYISFTDADFDALLGEYLRPKVSEILFDK